MLCASLWCGLETGKRCTDEQIVPVTTRIGSHAYGTTYPGPIGEIISPHMMGLAATCDLDTHRWLVKVRRKAR